MRDSGEEEREAGGSAGPDCPQEGDAALTFPKSLEESLEPAAVPITERTQDSIPEGVLHPEALRF